MIPIYSKNVSFLHNGFQFYEHIIKSICKAKDRVVLSSLYIGGSVKEDLMVTI